jgi:hypothetical protein
MTFRHGRIAGKHQKGDLIREGRNAEDIAAHIRRHEQHDAVREAYRGETKRLADLLRAEGLDAVADLIKRGRWRKRDARSQVDEMAHRIAAELGWREELVRQRHKGGRLPRHDRPRLIEGKLTDMAEMGELDPLSPANADQERVRHDRARLKDRIRKILEHKPAAKALAANHPAGRKRKRIAGKARAST